MNFVLFSSIAQGHFEHNGNNQRIFETVFSIHQMCSFHSNVLPPTPQSKKAKNNLVDDVNEEQIEIKGASPGVGHSQKRSHCSQVQPHISGMFPTLGFT